MRVRIDGRIITPNNEVGFYATGSVTFNPVRIYDKGANAVENG